MMRRRSSERRLQGAPLDPGPRSLNLGGGISSVMTRQIRGVFGGASAVGNVGDAAHAMSPAGGVGINLAIADAVATARLLAEPLRDHRLTTRDLAGEPGSGLSGANDDDSVLVAVVGWHGDVVSVPAGHAADAGLKVGGGKWRVATSAEVE